MKSSRLQALPGLLLRQTSTSRPGICTRWTHSGRPQPPIPPTLPFVPDVTTFLTLIGRGLRQHAAKFPTWDALFTLTSDQLRELGIEPPRTRRYLLRWRKRFSEGDFGTGGDLQYVEGGKAQLRILETEKDALTKERRVVNVPFGKEIDEVPRDQLQGVRGYSVSGPRTIGGPYALPMKGGGALIEVTEGMWEDKQGHKVDGGERRKAEVRFRRKIAERKSSKEKGGHY